MADFRKCDIETLDSTCLQNSRLTVFNNRDSFGWTQIFRGNMLPFFWVDNNTSGEYVVILLGGHQYFGGICCLYLQNQNALSLIMENSRRLFEFPPL